MSGFDFFNYCIVMMNKIVFALYKFGGNVHIVIKLKSKKNIYSCKILISIYFPLAFFTRFTPFINIDPLVFICLNGHGTVCELLMHS